MKILRHMFFLAAISMMGLLLPWLLSEYPSIGWLQVMSLCFIFALYVSDRPIWKRNPREISDPDVVQRPEDEDPDDKYR